MRVLVVKTSSLGDIIHAMPALTDANNMYPGIRFHWVCEPSFQQVPKWHPRVKRVIPVALRKWRKHLLSPKTWHEWRIFLRQLRCDPYDVVIDAQGLLKSAFVARKAIGKRYGLDWQSAWEPLASLTYHHHATVDPKLHAISRMRLLFGQALDYEPDLSSLDYGLDMSNHKLSMPLPEKPFVVLLHGTVWDSKQWPVSYWQQLAKQITQEGFQVLLPWGNDAEHIRAQTIANGISGADVLPRMSLNELAPIIAKAKGVAAVDTGLGHVSAALGVPTVSVYGPTNAEETGALGKDVVHIQSDFKCSPCKKMQCKHPSESSVEPVCFAEITPQRVWDSLQARLS